MHSAASDLACVELYVRAFTLVRRSCAEPRPQLTPAVGVQVQIPSVLVKVDQSQLLSVHRVVARGAQLARPVLKDEATSPPPALHTTVQLQAGVHAMVRGDGVEYTAAIGDATVFVSQGIGSQLGAGVVVVQAHALKLTSCHPGPDDTVVTEMLFHIPPSIKAVRGRARLLLGRAQSDNVSSCLALR